MKIGVLDSGVGGLTILKALMAKHPNHEYIYFGDTIHLPFGEKTKEEVVNYGNKIIEFLESKNVDLIIVACGTLSSNISFIHSNKPLIDLITPLENKLDNYKKISIMATPLTIKTNAFKNYIHTNLNLIAAPLLVPLIENNELDKVDECLKKYLENTLDSDALLLGCTHYPLIKDHIEKYFKKRIITFDEFILEKIDDSKESSFNLQLYFSLLNDKIINNVKNILEMENIVIERVNLDDKK